MTAKEYLWRVRDAARELKCLEQEYEQAKADILHLKGIAYDGDRVSGGKIGDLSDAIEKLEGYAQRLNGKWNELIALRKEAEERIDDLKDGRYRAILKRRYLCGQSWEQVAVTMGYTYRGVTGLHGKALKAFDEINCS